MRRHNTICAVSPCASSRSRPSPWETELSVATGRITFARAHFDEILWAGRRQYHAMCPIGVEDEPEKVKAQMRALIGKRQRTRRLTAPRRSESSRASSTGPTHLGRREQIFARVALNVPVKRALRLDAMERNVRWPICRLCGRERLLPGAIRCESNFRLSANQISK